MSNECDKGGEQVRDYGVSEKMGQHAGWHKIKKSLLRKFLDWWNLKPNSIFRVVDRPTFYVKTELRNGENWIVTYIRCDECSRKSEECSFDYSDRKWKCNKCK